MTDKVEIWREKKSGKRRGRLVRWDEDHYRISRPKLVQKTVPILDESGKQKADKNGLIFDDRMVPVLNEDGSQVFDVLVESLVTDSFLQFHRAEYDAFIKENGDRKDERYIPRF
jgi:hypothetical protein